MIKIIDTILQESEDWVVSSMRMVPEVKIVAMEKELQAKMSYSIYLLFCNFCISTMVIPHAGEVGLIRAK